MRYMVERPSGEVEDVGASEFMISDSGAIAFHVREGHFTEPVIVYAPGQWLTVTPEAE